MNVLLMIKNAGTGILELALNHFELSNLLEAAHLEQSAVMAVQLLLASSKTRFFATKAQLVLYALAAGLQPMGSILYDEWLQYFKKNGKGR